MKGVFQQFLAIALSFLIFFSTLSLSIDMHFCGDHLVDLSIGRKAATCGMETASSGVSGKCIMAAMECCTDFEIVLQAQEELQAHDDGYSISRILLSPLAPPAVAPTSYQVPARAPVLHFREYSPPTLVRKVHLLHESFLI